ncbi:MAG: NAD-dependent epimerase/dehydratase family protein [Anaerolineae bacterium]|jgi:UDP-glucose 4-epimerase|nr:NAD-dependent epimerase/dehydratase family protein [Anaerolineae bacterium]MBT7073690.1 NAD-dependent epimerase/dehydratase family protein [Anaerolineae bacterium]MBT7990888.1 NAD-dependent epimerase/dehydratase family protein [Anaerolineae bacterium]
MANIIVTGGAGFIGSHLVSELIKNQHKVTVIDDLSTGKRQNLPDNVNFIHASLENIESGIFKGIDIVYHLASIAGESVSLFAPDACYKRNVISGYNVLMHSLKFGVRRIVFSSSMAVYGNKRKAPFKEKHIPNPTDPYGLSKYEMEKLLDIYGGHTGLEWVSLRLHNVYGPRINLNDPYRGVVGIFINLLLHEKAPVLYGGDNHVRAFTYIDDVIPYLVQSGFEDKYNEKILNIGSDEKTKLVNLAYLLIKMTDFRGEPIFYPERPGEKAIAYSSHSQAKSLLGFSAKTPLRYGLEKTLDWAKKQQIPEFNYSLMRTEFELENIMPKTWKEKLL